MKLIGFLLGFLLLFGCAPRESVTIPVIPPFKYALNEQGEPWVFGYTDVTIKVRALINEVQPEQVPRLEVSDDKYIVVDHEWMLELIKWWDSLKWSLGIEYRSQAFDCDNFADFLAAVVDLANIRGQQVDAEIIVGTLSVFQKHEFGGVPAGVFHALNFFASEKGLFVLEPQGKNSSVIEYKKYPNAKYVKEIKLN